LSYNAPGGDNGIIMNCDTTQHGHIQSEPNPIADANWSTNGFHSFWIMPACIQGQPASACYVITNCYFVVVPDPGEATDPTPFAQP